MHLYLILVPTGFRCSNGTYETEVVGLFKGNSPHKAKQLFLKESTRYFASEEVLAKTRDECLDDPELAHQWSLLELEPGWA